MEVNCWHRWWCWQLLRSWCYRRSWQWIINLALLVLMAPVDLEFLPVELAHFRSLVLLELVPMVSLSHTLVELELLVQQVSSEPQLH